MKKEKKFLEELLKQDLNKVVKGIIINLLENGTKKDIHTEGVAN